MAYKTRPYLLWGIGTNPFVEYIVDERMLSKKRTPILFLFNRAAAETLSLANGQSFKTQQKFPQGLLNLGHATVTTGAGSMNLRKIRHITAFQEAVEGRHADVQPAPPEKTWHDGLELMPFKIDFSAPPPSFYAALVQHKLSDSPFLNWRVKPNDWVRQGEIIAEYNVETLIERKEPDLLQNILIRMLKRKEPEYSGINCPIFMPHNGKILSVVHDRSGDKTDAKYLFSYQQCDTPENVQISSSDESLQWLARAIDDRHGQTHTAYWKLHQYVAAHFEKNRDSCPKVADEDKGYYGPVNDFIQKEKRDFLRSRIVMLDKNDNQPAPSAP